MTVPIYTEISALAALPLWSLMLLIAGDSSDNSRKLKA